MKRKFDPVIFFIAHPIKFPPGKQKKKKKRTNWMMEWFNNDSKINIYTINP